MPLHCTYIHTYLLYIRTIYQTNTFEHFVENLRERTVRIYRPSKTATQSGKQGAKLWKIDFDILPDGARWENPLIGWASRYYSRLSSL
jgi:NADH dehydrogenase (ubiquinone) Fe-S protein 4